DVDVRILLQAVLHRRLRRSGLTLAVSDARDLFVAALDPEPLQEPVVPQRADRRAGMLVEHPDRHLLALRRRAGGLGDQDAGVEVVRREESVGRALRGCRRVERDRSEERRVGKGWRRRGWRWYG